MTPALMLWRCFWRWSRALVAAPSGDETRGTDEREGTHLVDPRTRTFWSRGAAAPATLVETESPAAVGHHGRVAMLLERHACGVAVPLAGRPRANPAFSEAVFVELIRAQRYTRAFELLSPECQRKWGSASAFAQAQREGNPRRLQGVETVAVRYLGEWTDPDAGTTYQHVAELDVEYTLDSGRQHVVVARTVHLVGVDGKWRSLSYP